MGSSLFSPEVVAAVARHMNTDHPEDSLLIVRALGGQPSATEARVVGVNDSGVVFSAVVGGEAAEAQVPWASTPAERAQIRTEVVQMYLQACAALGIQPRQDGEH